MRTIASIESLDIVYSIIILPFNTKFAKFYGYIDHEAIENSDHLELVLPKKNKIKLEEVEDSAPFL